MKAFYAFPDGKKILDDAISGAIEISNSKICIQPWKTLNILGFKVDDLIREKILDAEFLIADITFPNHNVYYEIGYAIGVGKPVVPTVNTAIDKSIARIQRIGLFDTIGWLTYDNASDLSAKLKDWRGSAWTSKFFLKRNYVQPLFILDTATKTDFRNHIFHAVDNSHVNYRTFDPSEVPRLSAAQAISEVSSSAGIIVQLLVDEIVDSSLNNLRAAFILGLSHGFEVDILAIQYENGPVPLDYRDFVKNSTFPRETTRHTEQFCSATLVANQRAQIRDTRPRTGILGEIDLGSPTAENEIQKLKYYFVETAEFSRALRAEGAIVIGRKGSGKTAIHLQVAEKVLRNRAACVVDIRPASHNLSEMREALLNIISAGVFDHTIAAFWQYILYVEIFLKIREISLPRSRNDYQLQERIREAEDQFSLNDSIVSGDFTSRLDTAVKNVIFKIEMHDDSTSLRSQFTNIMFEQPIKRLRDTIKKFSDQYDYIFLLIDDLDKGWPPTRVKDHDIGMVRHLIEVLNKIQRDLSKQNIIVKHLLFLRSDIYEKLVELTSDRGKYNLVRVDWSDPQQLKHLLKQRVTSDIDSDQRELAWTALNQRIEGGMDVVDRMIEGSLRRPRFLIDLCERTLSVAINRGHNVVAKADLDEGLRQMSLYLVSDFGYEMRDVSGTSEDLFYLFIGTPDFVTYEELTNLLGSSKLDLSIAQTIELLLWYGFLGVVGSGNNSVYIYDRSYDFRRLRAELPSNLNEAVFSINPAFLKGLESS